MALNWEWNDCMGEVVYANGAVLNLYKGNALMIALREWSEDGKDMYTLAWFMADKEHMKNMLGLTKGYDNCMADWGIKRIRLDATYKDVPTIVQYFAKAKMPIEIELYVPTDEG